MKKSDLKQLIKEEIKKALRGSPQPGDVVLYKGTRYVVIDEDEFIITLKNPKTQKIIKLNYNQFKNQSVDLKEVDTSRLSHLNAIKNLIKKHPEKELDKVVSLELSRIERDRLEDLTREEAQSLNVKLIKIINQKIPSQTIPGGVFPRKSKGSMGATYTGD